MDRLVSKIAAGGLSAGIFLIWWPAHVHGEGLEQLVLRGLLWTLFAELLIVVFGRVEARVESRVRAVLAPRRELVRAKIDLVPERARTGGAVALAFCGIAAPLALLASEPGQLVKDEPRVVKQVIVQRPVVEKKVVVRKVVTQAPLQSAGAAPSVPATQVTPAAQPAKRMAAAKRTTRSAPVRRSSAATTTARTVAPPAAKTTATAPDAAPEPATADTATDAPETGAVAPPAAAPQP